MTWSIIASSRIHIYIIVMNKIIYLFCFIIFFSSCQKKSKRNDLTNLQEINLDFFNQEKSEQLWDSIFVVPLETKAECLLGSLRKLVVNKYGIFILDSNKNFFVFNLDGSFRYKVVATGRGPREITKLTNFYVCEYKKYVAIYDHVKHKFFHYNFNGDLEKILDCSTDLFTDAVDMKVLSDGKLLLRLRFMPGVQHAYAVINLFDYSFEKFMFPYPFKWKKGASDVSNLKMTSNISGDYLINFLSDTIYCYKEGHVYPNCVLKSCLKPVNYKLIQGNINDYGDIVSYLNKKPTYSKGIQNLFFTDSVGYTLYFYQNRWNHAFWDLNTGKGTIFPALYGHKNIFEDLKFAAVTENYFIGLVPAYNILPENVSSNIPKVITEKLVNIKEDDNPVLVFYYVNSKKI